MVVAALLVGLAFIVASGVSAGDAVGAFVQGVVGSDLNIAATVRKMVPLTLVALGWIVAFRASRFHVGFPGQILLGGLFISVVALKVPLPGVLHLPLTMLAGMAGGALFAGIAAWLWARRGVNEILSTLLLNLVAAQILAWWVRQPFHDPSTPLPLTRPLPESSRWPVIIPDTQLHWDIVLIPLAVAAVYFLLNQTTLGLRLRLVGANEKMARFAGISPSVVGALAIVVSGALAGLAAGSLVLAGTTAAMGEDMGAGYGFTGIAVALVARNSTVGVVPSALLFAALDQGGGGLAATIGINASLVTFIQGLMICLVLAATSGLEIYRRRRAARGGPASRARAAEAPSPQPVAPA